MNRKFRKEITSGKDRGGDNQRGAQGFKDNSTVLFLKLSDGDAVVFLKLY